MVTAAGSIGVIVTINVLVFLCLGMRWWIMISKGQWTPYKTYCNLLLILAALINLASSGLSIQIVVTGIVTRRLSVLDADRLLFSSWMLKMQFTAHLLYYASLCIIKAAYLFFYTDMYKRIETTRRIALWAARIFWVGGYIAGIFLIFTWCLPFKQNWNFLSGNPHCPAIFTTTLFTILSSINIGTDLCILLVPLLVLTGLNLRNRVEKLSLIVVFGVGAMCIVTATVRYVIIDRHLTAHRFDWDTLYLYIVWSHTEVFLGICALSLPAFRHLVTDLTDKICMRFGFDVVDTINNRCSQRKSRTVNQSSVASGRLNELNQNPQPGPPPFNFSLPRKSLVSNTTITELPLLDIEKLKSNNQSQQSHQSEQSSSATFSKQNIPNQSQRGSQYTESQYTGSRFSGHSSISRREQDQYFREEEVVNQSTPSQSRRQSQYAESSCTEQSSISRREQEQYSREEELELAGNCLGIRHGPREVQIPDWRMVSMEEILSSDHEGSDDWGRTFLRDPDEEEAVVKI